MRDLFQLSEWYDVIPELNSAGRICNYHTRFREGETEDDLFRVMADEWQRFNQLAGRQHEIVDGLVIYNPDLEPCVPDGDAPVKRPGKRQTGGTK